MRRIQPNLTALICIVIVTAISASSCSVHFWGAGQSSRDTRLVTDTSRQAHEQASLGKYRNALEIYSNAYDRHHLRGLRQGYARMGEQVVLAADAAYQKKDFAEAGSIYRALFESGITTRDFAQSLTFDDDYLDKQIKACSKTLMEIGLMKYREEKLDEAIAIWKKILAFDLDNKNVRSAIDTATVQLQQLKNLK
jgi:tetratricopeptide (TPR) repeat protein